MAIDIVSTAAAEHLGEKLVGQKGIRVISPGKNKENSRYFPDGEVYTRIAEIHKLRGRTVLLHSGAPKPNSGLVELEMLLEILRGSRARPIEVFFTYFPYGMQDKVFQDGETIAAENLIKKLVKYYGVKKIYTIDAHFFGREWIGRYPLINISVVDLLTQVALKDYPQAIFLGPDKGFKRRTGLKSGRKTRLDSFTNVYDHNQELERTVKDKIIGVIDDILETGGTMERFYDECIKYGAEKLFALITHGALKSGIKRIQAKYSKLYLTDTIQQDEANVDVVETILGAIKKA